MGNTVIVASVPSTVSLELDIIPVQHNRSIFSDISNDLGLSGVVNDVDDVSKPVIDAILSNAGDLVQAMFKYIIKELDLGNIIDGVVSRFKGVLDINIDNLFNYIMDPVRKLFIAIKKAAINVMTYIRGALVDLGNDIVNIIDTIVIKITDILSSFRRMVTNLVISFKERINAASVRIQGSIDNIPNMLNSYKNSIANIGDEVINSIESLNILSRMRDMVHSALTFPERIIVDLYNRTKRYVESIISDLSMQLDIFINKLTDAAKKMIYEGGRRATALAEQVLEETKEITEEIYNKVKTSVIPAIENDLNSIIKEGESAGEEIVSVTKKSVGVLTANIYTTIDQFMSNINIIENIARGLVAGIIIITILLFMK